MEEICQKFVVEGCRIDVGTYVNRVLVVADFVDVSGNSGVFVAVGVRLTLKAGHEGPRGDLVEIRLLHGVSITRQTWRRAPGIQLARNTEESRAG